MNGDGKRHCASPETVQGDSRRTTLVEKATDAICKISTAVEIHGVTVWQTGAAQDAGRRLG